MRTHTHAQVVSGGVASNSYLRSKLEHLARHYNLRLEAPPPRLCTDNGVMIAWAGMERLLEGARPQREGEGPLASRGVCWSDLEKCLIDPTPKAPLGEDISDKMVAEKIKVRIEYWKARKRPFFKQKQNQLEGLAEEYCRDQQSRQS